MTRTVIHIVAFGAILALTGCTASTIPVASSPSPSASTPSATVAGNTWLKPGSVLATAIPLGDGHISTITAAVGSVFSCTAGNANIGGSQTDGPWITGAFWNAHEKIAVNGKVNWPTAKVTITAENATRVIVTNDLPTDQATGIFPIATADPAYAYDRNPNTISAATSTTIILPATAQPAATPTCLGGGAIGVLLNGVFLYDALDGPGRDAVAHEEQDACDGHPERTGQYHYHEIPTCLENALVAQSTVVGWANDGFPIVVERDAAGNLPNNADLDACHGRTSSITVDGKATTQYHYSATLEYPYTMGCYYGTRS